MGNQKNKANHRNRRHIYLTKKNPKKQKPLPPTPTVPNPPTSQRTLPINVPATSETTLPINAPDGSRIINLDKLASFLNTFTQHTLTCPRALDLENANPAITIEGESQQGLASIISVKCMGCNEIVKLESSAKIVGPKGIKRWECNVAAVWGQMATGGGYSKLNETMTTLGVPCMSQKSFINTERQIGEWWRDKLHESMIEAGCEERKLAIERKDFHEGVPATTVIVDAGWSKRSHRHSYNAKSGVGVIIGYYTQKLLHIGVRNKYCAACARGIEDHICYQNWNESSSAMETDIIIDGFCRAERVHGLRYMRFIGDGDSSVYPTLLTTVPGWGRAIVKMECANHACKCYRGSLEKVVQENPKYKGKGGLTAKMRQRLTTAARCAIKMRSQEENRKEAIKKLQSDLQNGPYHCFGIHDNCSTDFCTSARSMQNQECTSGDVRAGECEELNEDDDTLPEIAANQV